MEEQRPPKLVLVDGSACFYRAFFAIRHLSAPDGLPTNAIFGFVSMLMKVLEQQKPTHLAVVFDSKGATYREKIYPDYKGHRPAMPEDLVPQIPFIQEIVRAYNFPALEQAGFEADDIIATVTKKAEKAGIPVFIVSGDKDMMQLVSDTVVLVDTVKDRVIGPAEVKEKFGVGPEGVVDVLGLMGDSVDNVPGVPGVGEKTARELIDKYGTLENVLAHAADVGKAKIRESLLQNAQLARLSKELVTLRTDVPISTALDDFRLRAPDEAKLVALFERLGFARFLDKYKRAKTVSYDDYHLVSTEAEFESMLTELRTAPAFSFDLETTSADPISAEIVGLSFSPRAHRAFYCPVGHRYLGAPPQLPLKRTLELLRPLLEDPAQKKYGQNLKYDTTVLGRRGIRVAGIACDAMVASYLLDPNRRAHGLAVLALQFLDHKMISYEDVTGKGKKQINFSEVDVQTACTYSCEDADVAFILSEMFLEKLKECSTGVPPVPAGVSARADSGSAGILPARGDSGSADILPAGSSQHGVRPAFAGDGGLLQLLQNVEIPLLTVLVDMETAGVKIEPKALAALSAELAGRLDRLRVEIFAMAGTEFNVDSPKQLQEVLFERLALRKGRKTKTGYSTDSEELERLAAEYPVAARVLEYRSAMKLKNTYTDVLPTLVNPRTGRVHTSFNQTVAATGRLSSSEPNLQNIPIRTEEGRKIRRAFVPEDGFVFISGDYSQIELRVLAHLSGDERLIEAFSKGEDIHARTAAEVFGVARADVSDEMRRSAKAINFGIVYGMGAHGLATQLSIPHGEAQRYIETYFARYAGVRRYLDSVLAGARTERRVTTLLGRVRATPDIDSPNAQARAAAERIALNTPIQGTAADLMKVAMINLHNRLAREKLRTRMLLQVHDELLLEVPVGEESTAFNALREEMQNALPLRVQVRVDILRGTNWGEMESVESSE